MEIILTIIHSACIMYILAFVFAIFFIKSLISCIRGSEASVLTRIISLIVFGGLMYFFYWYAGTLTAPNAIDKFIFDTWIEMKKFFGFVKTQI